MQKKDEGSIIKGFAVGVLAMAVGTFVATRYVGDSVFGHSSAKDKAIALLAVFGPIFFVGQRALAAASSGRSGESQGLFLGLVSGAMLGLFASFAIGMNHAGL